MNERTTNQVQDDGSHGALPVARVEPIRRLSLAWLVPALALLFVGVIVTRSMMMRGTTISVQLANGHGLKSGDALRYQGIVAGEVTSVTLNERGPGVLAEIRLVPEAEMVARAGSRFWVVRPQVGLEGIAGIETIVGPRYLAVIPGEGLSQRNFVGLSEPPVVDVIESDDLEIMLFAQQRGSIRKGAPVLYRQVRVGTVLSVALASDSSAVEARVHIESAFRQLVRPESKFWDSSGVEAEAKITGFSVRVPSLTALISGGVSFATPGESGSPVSTGHRFMLEAEANEEWLEWEPAILVGSVHLPAGAPMPVPLRAKMAWREGRFWKSAEMRQGWVLLTERGLLGPADLFTPSEKADQDSVVLEVAGTRLALDAAPTADAGGVTLFPGRVDGDVWPTERLRRADAPEECIAVADASDQPFPLSVARLTALDGAWGIDPALSIDASWHGAMVVARSDGRIIGVIVFDDDEDEARIMPIPAGTVNHGG